MKKAIAIVLSVMFVFALTTVTFAAEKKMKKGSQKKISGEVTAVDAKANTVTVKGKKKEVTVSLGDTTVIKAGKEKKTLADLKAGDKVHVSYTEADGKSVATRIALKGEKSEKKMEKKHRMKAAEKKAASEAPAPEKQNSAGY
jgi:Cu/Ag efflux protein CusF